MSVYDRMERTESNEMDASPNMLEAALSYAARGWRVVPLHEVIDSRDGPTCSCGRSGCESQGKHPRPKAWQDAATAGEPAIRRWWSQWPNANVGIALGTLSGIVSVDVDTAEGEKQLRQLAQGDPEPTLEYRTGKGRRLLYAIPEELEFDPKTTALKGADGSESVRFQGTGGQCVMPPSQHPSGKQYEWVRSEGDPALAPDWLLQQMRREEQTNHHPQNPSWADQGARDAFTEGRDFNRDADWWADILSTAGFREAGNAGNVFRFTRPGKKSGVSVTVGHYRAADGTPALFVFSGSIPGLDAGKCYDKFGAFCRLHCGGDFDKAADRIKAMGFEKRRPPRTGQAPGSSTGSASAPGSPAEPKDAKDFGAVIPLDDPAGSPAAFPTHVLPAGLQDLVLSASSAIPCPVDYPAATALAVAAGAIGASYDLQVKRGFLVPASLWVCVVAPPGSGKSPGVHPIVKPVFDEQASRKGSTKGPAFVSDITVEKLASFLTDFPRGLLMYWDEMAGWLTSFNQYKGGGKGNDRAHYLSIWDGRALKVDRKGADSPPVFVPRPRLSIAGGIQPEVLDELREGPSDGLFDRMLFAYPADPGLAVETFAEVDESAANTWSTVLRTLYASEMHAEGTEGARPKIIPLVESGKPIWQDWTRLLAERASSTDAPPYLRTIAAKIQGYAARLALIVHLLRETYGEIKQGLGLGEDDMLRGVELANYFLAHAERVRRAAGRDTRLVRTRLLLRWLQGKSELLTVTRSDAWASLRKNAAFTAPEDLDEPLRLLAIHRCLKWQAGPGGQSGRYAVNPAIHLEGRSI